jgi:hypothetical protein
LNSPSTWRNVYNTEQIHQRQKQERALPSSEGVPFKLDVCFRVGHGAAISEEDNRNVSGCPRKDGDGFIASLIYAGATAIAESQSTPAHTHRNVNFPTIGLSNVAQGDTDTNWIGSLAWS